LRNGVAPVTVSGEGLGALFARGRAERHPFRRWLLAPCSVASRFRRHAQRSCRGETAALQRERKEHLNPPHSLRHRSITGCLACCACVILVILPFANGHAATLCTAVADAVSARIIVQDGACERRVTPASTFKIAISLMGYDSGFLIDEHRRGPMI